MQIADAVATRSPGAADTAAALICALITAQPAPLTNNPIAINVKRNLGAKFAEIIALSAKSRYAKGKYFDATIFIGEATGNGQTENRRKTIDIDDPRCSCRRRAELGAEIG